MSILLTVTPILIGVWLGWYVNRRANYELQRKIEQNDLDWQERVDRVRKSPPKPILP